MEGEVEWDCLADGKQDKGLSSSGPAQNESTDKKKSALAVQVTEMVQNDRNGVTTTSISENVLKSDAENHVTVEDAYEFDEDLDKVASA